MKKAALRLMALAIVCTLPIIASAQLSKEQINERKALVKASKQELNQKATKAARQEAKKLEKEGWKVAPGALPLEKQLDRSYLMQMEFDENYLPKYMMGSAMSVGGNYDAAHLQAIELAKQDLAGQIQTEVTALVENTVANSQLGPAEAESITKSIIASKNFISQSIGRVLTVLEAYRTLKNGNKEVMVKIAYSSTQALNIAKKAIREDLERQGDELHGKLDQILGW